MTKPDDVAFGIPATRANGFCPGLTKLEYFAAQSLATTWFKTPEEAADHAFKAGKALIDRLNKEVKP
jgi:hypothetical protein